MFGETRLTYRRRTVLGCWSILADLFRICLLVYVGCLCARFDGRGGDHTAAA